MTACSKRTPGRSCGQVRRERTAPSTLRLHLQGVAGPQLAELMLQVPREVRQERVSILVRHISDRQVSLHTTPHPRSAAPPSLHPTTSEQKEKKSNPGSLSTAWAFSVDAVKPVVAPWPKLLVLRNQLTRWAQESGGKAARGGADLCKVRHDREARGAKTLGIVISCGGADVCDGEGGQAPPAGEHLLQRAPTRQGGHPKRRSIPSHIEVHRVVVLLHHYHYAPSYSHSQEEEHADCFIVVFAVSKVEVDMGTIVQTSLQFREITGPTSIPASAGASSCLSTSS